MRIATPLPIHRRAFTLVELLVSIAILAVLLSILLPVLGRAREFAHQAQCASNLHQLMEGFVVFAHDHEDQLPGGFWDSVFPNPDPDHRDWLRRDPFDWTTGPEGGTLFRYLHHPAVYCCPSLDCNPPAPGAAFGPMCGSNGRYDYVSMLVFTGARIGNIKPQSQLTFPDGHIEYYPTPVIVEGAAMDLNGFHMADYHTSDQEMSHTHRGGAFYAAIDTSVTWINEPPGGCHNWQSQGPHGKLVAMDSFSYFWGAWNQR
ncbi:MAG: N-terminal cleavage protein [Phycisphaerales bacterium]|nr:N-terminal cleavage protein [Phycisphaerales bacterium]